MKLHEREPLLAKLKDELPASRRKPGRLVLVAGEAGIGKTSLVHAFCASVDGVPVLWVACDAALPPSPFAPLADIADTAEAYCDQRSIPLTGTASSRRFSNCFVSLTAHRRSSSWRTFIGPTR